MTKTHAFRLLPGSDLKKGIREFVVQNGIRAGWIACCVGSLTRYHIRFANQSKGCEETGFFEIANLSGTVSQDGVHLHIVISNTSGTTLGGHLLDGTLIYTTAEIVLQEAQDLIFSRKTDVTTGWAELEVRRKP